VITIILLPEPKGKTLEESSRDAEYLSDVKGSTQGTAEK
jgi:hypothetical protein